MRAIVIVMLLFGSIAILLGMFALHMVQVEKARIYEFIKEKDCYELLKYPLPIIVFNYTNTSCEPCVFECNCPNYPETTTRIEHEGLPLVKK